MCGELVTPTAQVTVAHHYSCAKQWDHYLIEMNVICSVIALHNAQ